MSSSSEATRRRLWRRPTLLRALGLLALVLVLAIAARPRGVEVGTPLPVRRADLVLGVEVDGELVAVHSTPIGVPPVSETSFKITFLAPEGAAVKKGQPVLGFDTETLVRLLAEKRAELEEAAKKVEQKELDLHMKRLDLDQRAAVARSELTKAELKADAPPIAVSSMDLKLAQLDRAGRQGELANLAAERRVTETTSGSELMSLRQQRERARGRVGALQAAIEAMTVRAPQDGVVVYETSWNDQKKKIGDSVWSGERVISLPDLREMKADGYVDEADGGPVAEGQPVTLKLEARPDFDLRGRVRRIARTVRTRSWRTPVKSYRVEIALDATDPTFMRPAMRFRGEIETGRVASLLLVPREAVFLHDDGPVAWKKTRLGWRETTLQLGRSNSTQVEVLAALREGDLVSPLDLATAAGPERRGGAAGSAR
ncbi:MAG TPA: HlyD family efflux transporter periplasmic adaptor subunit [Vicinamibacteria bacterium]|nr:HlyD family efflux transporter periplasmic adaptor subunit [Vicinamibacteria bacterium]